MQIIFLPGDEPFSQYPNHYAYLFNQDHLHSLNGEYHVFKTRSNDIIALISILCLLIVYLLWNNMSLKGNWPDDSDTVSIEWYDYKGIYHNQTLTEEERSGLTQLIKDITPKKIYITPQSRSGEQSYNIDYSGKRSVRYTVKSSGLIIILNNEFPFQHSV